MYTNIDSHVNSQLWSHKYFAVCRMVSNSLQESSCFSPDSKLSFNFRSFPSSPFNKVILVSSSSSLDSSDSFFSTRISLSIISITSCSETSLGSFSDPVKNGVGLVMSITFLFILYRVFFNFALSLRAASSFLLNSSLSFVTLSRVLCEMAGCSGAVVANLVCSLSLLQRLMVFEGLLVVDIMFAQGIKVLRTMA